jgi:hypothetical protein
MRTISGVAKHATILESITDIVVVCVFVNIVGCTVHVSGPNSKLKRYPMIHEASQRR